MTIDVEGFGEVLKKLRNRKKKSRSNVAQQLKIHPSTLEKWERGDVLPDKARVKELIDALKLDEAERLLLLEAYAGHRILPSLHNLPVPQNPYFTGRETILAQLHSQLAPGSQVALTQSPQAISGLGGIGKTQVALHYAYRFQKVYSHVLWVTADSQEMIIMEFARLALSLDLPEKEEQNQNKIVQAVQRWLREYLNWLLILDNIEDLRLVSSFVPPGHLGSVLLTTRRKVTEPVAQAIELNEFSEDDGLHFLLKRAKRLAPNGFLNEIEASEIANARTITQKLGGLPLALDQAGAYIIEKECSLSHYLNVLEKQENALLKHRGNIIHDHPQSVTATFSLAFEQIQQKNEGAIELLKFCAFLAPDSIPLELFTQEAEVYLEKSLASISTDILQFDQVLEILQAYSLVKRDRENETLSIHRLVQTVLKDSLSEGLQKQWGLQVIDVINHLFPSVFGPGFSTFKDWQICERYLVHGLEAVKFIQKYNIFTDATIHLLHKLGNYLCDRAQYSDAQSILILALEVNQHTDASKRSLYIETLNNLGVLSFYQGQYKQAIHYLKEVLIFRERLYGLKDASIAQSLDFLAWQYVEIGRYDEAIPLLLRATSIAEHVQTTDFNRLDLGHIKVALATCYIEQKLYKDAEILLLQEINHLIEENGITPTSSGALFRLATVYEGQENYQQAEHTFDEALKQWDELISFPHPWRAFQLQRIALFYLKQGNIQQAVVFAQEAMIIAKQTLSTEHLWMGFCIGTLAKCENAQLIYPMAKQHYYQSLAILANVLEPDHLWIGDLQLSLKELEKI